jgi:hypothetical protein
VVPATARTDRGLFDVHRVGDRLLLRDPGLAAGPRHGADEPVRLGPGRSRQRRRPDGAQHGGALGARDGRVHLRAVSHENTATEGTALHLAVQNSNFAPVLHSFPVRARGQGTSVIDATDLYLGDVPAFTLPRATRTRLAVRSYDRERSWLEWARSFPINVEVRVVQTYAADQPPSNPRGGAVSFEVNHSMILLPKEPMKPRLWDERVGYISIAQTDYSRDFQGVRPQRYIVRYRLEPSDTGGLPARRAGGAGEPVGLVHRPGDAAGVDPLLRGGDPGVERGLRAGRLPQRAAGARRADRGGGPGVQPARRALLGGPLRRDAGALRELRRRRGRPALRRGDPRAHQHVPRGDGAAALVARLAGGAANPRVPRQRLSRRTDGRGAALRVSHETAHSVGLPHNQRANFVFPVDSIRNPDFVRAHGPLRLVGGPHALQLRGAAGRRRAAGAADGALGPVRRLLGLPADPGGAHARGGAADAEPLDRRARRPALVPLRLGAVRDGRGVGPVPDDRGHLRRPGRGRRAGDEQPAPPPPT